MGETPIQLTEKEARKKRAAAYNEVFFIPSQRSETGEHNYKKNGGSWHDLQIKKERKRTNRPKALKKYLQFTESRCMYSPFSFLS